MAKPSVMGVTEQAAKPGAANVPTSRILLPQPTLQKFPPKGI